MIPRLLDDSEVRHASGVGISHDVERGNEFNSGFSESEMTMSDTLGLGYDPYGLSDYSGNLVSPTSPVKGDVAVPPTPISQRFSLQMPWAEAPVARPPRPDLTNLSIIFPNLPTSGTKSRIETQVKTTIELARYRSGSSADYERIGTWKTLKLHKGSVARRAMKKRARPSDPATTLYLSTTVVRASDPSQTLEACSRCHTRETKKRLSVTEQQGHESADSDADTAAQPSSPSTMLVFHCSEALNIEQGVVDLSFRMTCYCAHHNEPVGYLINFTMRDNLGQIVARGTTPTIMIVDDHKRRLREEKPAGSPISTPEIPNVHPPVKKRRVATARVSTAPPRPSAPTPTENDSSGSTLYSSSQSSSLSIGDVSFGATHDSGYDSASLPPSVDASPPPNGSTPSGTMSHPFMFNDIFPPASHQMPLSPPSSQTSQRLGSTDDSGYGSTGIASLLDLPGSYPGAGMTNAPRPSSHSDDLLGHSLPEGAAPLPSLYSNPAAVEVMNPLEGFDPQFFPKVQEVNPNSGSLIGGTMVWVRGENFFPGVQCMFGETAVPTMWLGNNLLSCRSPPSTVPGPVVVSIEGFQIDPESNLGLDLKFFNYLDDSDTLLMAHALLAIGYKDTGRFEDPKTIASRIMNAAAGTMGGASGSAFSLSLGSSLGAVGRTTNSSDHSPEHSPEQLTGKNSSITQDSLHDPQLPPPPIPVPFIIATSDIEGVLIQSLGLLDSSSEVSLRAAISQSSLTGQTLLHLSAVLGYEKLTQHLLARGIDINARDVNGFTALHFAAMWNRFVCAKEILRAGADTRLKEAYGRTAEDIAQSRQYVSIAFMLHSASDRRNWTRIADDMGSRNRQIGSRSAHALLQRNTTTAPASITGATVEELSVLASWPQSPSSSCPSPSGGVSLPSSNYDTFFSVPVEQLASHFGHSVADWPLHSSLTLGDLNALSPRLPFYAAVSPGNRPSGAVESPSDGFLITRQSRSRHRHGKGQRHLPYPPPCFPSFELYYKDSDGQKLSSKPKKGRKPLLNGSASHSFSSPGIQRSSAASFMSSIQDLSIQTPTSENGKSHSWLTKWTPNVSMLIDKTSISEKPVAAGGFSTVYKGSWLDGRGQVAIKTLRPAHESQGDMKSKLRKALVRELQVWSTLRHENVLPLDGFLVFEERNEVAMISPWMQHGSASQFILKNPETDRWKLILGTATGLAYLHDNNIIHGDLKAANILISETGDATLCDFGLSKALGTSQEVRLPVSKTGTGSSREFPAGFTLSGGAGTVRWMAPELLTKEAGRRKLSQACDIYSLGMTMLEMLTGTVPYEDIATASQVVYAVHYGLRPKRPAPRLPLCREVDNDAWWLLQDCWKQIPHSRPTMPGIMRRLSIRYHSGGESSPLQ